MDAEPLKVGIVAPPWVPVPPPSYGGTELVLDVLARGLAERGHDVVLFTTGDSTCGVARDWLFKEADPDRIGCAALELRHASAAYDALADCDVIHDHTLGGLFVHERHTTVPVVATNHGPFDDDLTDIYRRAGVPVIAISHDQAGRAPGGIPIAKVIHHGLDLARYPFEPTSSTGGGAYLAALGRMNPTKGIDTAIEAARQAGLPLLIGAKMREQAERDYFDQVIRPLLGSGVEYLGELGHAEKIELLAGALALINPIRWPEPFGLVMIEAMACGTPVVATHQGAAPELIADGVTGYVADEVDELVAAVAAVPDIDRQRCREVAEFRFSMARMARDHLNFYRSLVDAYRFGRPRSRRAPIDAAVRASRPNRRTRAVRSHSP